MSNKPVETVEDWVNCLAVMIAGTGVDGVCSMGYMVCGANSYTRATAMVLAIRSAKYARPLENPSLASHPPVTRQGEKP